MLSVCLWEGFSAFKFTNFHILGIRHKHPMQAKGPRVALPTRCGTGATQWWARAWQQTQEVGTMGRYLCRALYPWPSTCTDGRPIEKHTSYANIVKRTWFLLNGFEIRRFLILSSVNLKTYKDWRYFFKFRHKKRNNPAFQALGTGIPSSNSFIITTATQITWAHCECIFLLWTLFYPVVEHPLINVYKDWASIFNLMHM